MSLQVVVWLALMVVFLVAEAMTVTVVSLWFAAGALAAMIAARNTTISTVHAITYQSIKVCLLSSIFFIPLGCNSIIAEGGAPVN